MSNKSVNKDAAAENESLPELLVQLAKTSAVVVRDEIELVIQRTREMMKAVRNGVLLIAAGAVLSFVALMCFGSAMIIGLTSYMHPVIAALVTGLAFALVGFVIALSGYRKLKKQVSNT